MIDIGTEAVPPSESAVNRSLHDRVMRCQDGNISLAERGNAWKDALSLVGRKEYFQAKIRQAQRPSLNGEGSVVRSAADDWTLATVSPELQQAMAQGQVSDRAAFALSEYFVKPGYHGLNTSQLLELARAFPPQMSGETFEAYKQRVEAPPAETVVSGREPHENWEMRREILDVLEIANNIQTSSLNSQFGKTIDLRYFIPIAAEALRLVHQVGAPDGIAQIDALDKQFFEPPDLARIQQQEQFEAVVKMGVDLELEEDGSDLVEGEWNRTKNMLSRLQRSGMHEEPDDEAPLGGYQGRHIIGRDTPINGGVYVGAGKREAIVVDAVKYPKEMNEVYSDVLNRALSSDLFRLIKRDPFNPRYTDLLCKIVYNVSAERLGGSRHGINKKVNDILELVKQRYRDDGETPPDDPKIPLNNYIRANAGVCRHRALLAGYILERLIYEGYMTGKVSVDRNTIKGQGGMLGYDLLNFSQQGNKKFEF